MTFTTNVSIGQAIMRFAGRRGSQLETVTAMHRCSKVSCMTSCLLSGHGPWPGSEIIKYTAEHNIGHRQLQIPGFLTTARRLAFSISMRAPSRGPQRGLHYFNWLQQVQGGWHWLADVLVSVRVRPPCSPPSFLPSPAEQLEGSR
jgi:hypothetical protein